MKKKLFRVLIISIITLFIFAFCFFLYNNRYSIETILYNKNESVAFNYLIILKKLSFKDSLAEDMKYYLSKINSEGVNDYELVQAIELAKKISTVIYESKSIEENISSDFASAVVDLIFLDTTEIKQYYKYIKNLNSVKGSIQSFKTRNAVIMKHYSSMVSLVGKLNEYTVNFYLMNGRLPLKLVNDI